ncbi:hypothetical protein CISIN_1g035357mg [Citrus sinensis]|uniref:Uncharacterized protein n=2 Tax=Citrus TaxID=2706 RepID=A0A067DG87_CITSI|nr:hypothetical protein CISIN_1g035357mg [Citrus sinensis]
MFSCYNSNKRCIFIRIYTYCLATFVKLNAQWWRTILNHSKFGWTSFLFCAFVIRLRYVRIFSIASC